MEKVHNWPCVPCWICVLEDLRVVILSYRGTQVDVTSSKEKVSLSQCYS